MAYGRFNFFHLLTGLHLKDEIILINYERSHQLNKWSVFEKFINNPSYSCVR